MYNVQIIDILSKFELIFKLYYAKFYVIILIVLESSNNFSICAMTFLTFSRLMSVYFSIYAVFGPQMNIFS